ncbi:hypothetical protein Ciccas_003184 [Cichlidogyrus casuarinus]|uniref:Uncharacterized protein n=1 Tax=Cichlidogyrus casuarinus TaxID=1844966 RepID=A0ABD2QF33_9PLAT
MSIGSPEDLLCRQVTPATVLDPTFYTMKCGHWDCEILIQGTEDYLNTVDSFRNFERARHSIDQWNKQGGQIGIAVQSDSAQEANYFLLMSSLLMALKDSQEVLGRGFRVHMVPKLSSRECNMLFALDALEGGDLSLFLTDRDELVLAKTALWSSQRYLVPFMTSGGLPTEFDDKLIYPLLTRMHTVARGTSNVLQGMLERVLHWPVNVGGHVALYTSSGDPGSKVRNRDYLWNCNPVRQFLAEHFSLFSSQSDRISVITIEEFLKDLESHARRESF